MRKLRNYMKVMKSNNRKSEKVRESGKVEGMRKLINAVR